MPQRWNKSAQIRRDQIESGLDLTFNEVFKPLFISNVFALSPSKILEVGAGTGHISKELAKRGVSVTAIEPSKGMFMVAKDVLLSSQVELLNCTSVDLPKAKKFDVVISNMVAHVVDDLKIFFESIRDQLVKGGSLIFTIPHPCFYNEYKRFFGEEYSYMASITKNVTFSITKDHENLICDVPYHHRPLSIYMNTLIDSGFSIEKFEEIYPDSEIQIMYGEKWKNPRYCLFVCKCT